jgi:hypothetical protein
MPIIIVTGACLAGVMGIDLVTLIVIVAAVTAGVLIERWISTAAELRSRR